MKIKYAVERGTQHNTLYWFSDTVKIAAITINLLKLFERFVDQKNDRLTKKKDQSFITSGT